MMKYFQNNILLLEKIFIIHVTNLDRFSNIIFLKSGRLFYKKTDREKRIVGQKPTTFIRRA